MSKKVWGQDQAGSDVIKQHVADILPPLCGEEVKKTKGNIVMIRLANIVHTVPSRYVGRT